MINSRLQLVTIAWFFWGYSLTFAPNGSAFIGNLHNFGLMNVLGEPSVATSKIPGLLFAFFQLQFATVTACIAVGGAAERIRTGPLLLWIFCWTTIVCASSSRSSASPSIKSTY
jgi:Amt family ammonium transporter